jgi:integrase
VNSILTTLVHFSWVPALRGPFTLGTLVHLRRSQCIQRSKAEQEKIFNDPFGQYRWDKIRQKIGLADLKFHDLRKTFGSVLAQNGVSSAITQKLLEHSSLGLTNKIYTNVDLVLRHAVDQIPAAPIPFI